MEDKRGGLNLGFLWIAYATMNGYNDASEERKDEIYNEFISYAEKKLAGESIYWSHDFISLYKNNQYIWRKALVVELVVTLDLRSNGPHGLCGFESRPGH